MSVCARVCACLCAVLKKYTKLHNRLINSLFKGNETPVNITTHILAHKLMTAPPFLPPSLFLSLPRSNNTGPSLSVSVLLTFCLSVPVYLHVFLSRRTTLSRVPVPTKLKTTSSSTNYIPHPSRPAIK